MDDGATTDDAIDDDALIQLLQEFEVVNSRVIDLTQRLITSQQRVAQLQAHLDNVRARESVLRAEYEAMQASFAYRLARRFWALRNQLQR